MAREADLHAMIRGEPIPAAGEIELCMGRPIVMLTVARASDGPVQAVSHDHVFETSAALAFYHDQMRSMRLNNHAATAVEPKSKRSNKAIPITVPPRALVVVLTYEQMMKGVLRLVHEIQLEATFLDGNKMETVHAPIR